MEVKLLGPLEVSVRGVPITPTAPKPRQLLAMLAMNAGRVVPVSVLVEELWGYEPIRTAQATAQTYIMQLRKCLLRGQQKTCAKDILATHYGGYVLNIPPESVDAHRYQQLVESGNQAVRGGEHERGAAMLREALDVWRGPALVDVQRGPRLDIHITRLEQSRLTAVESRIEAELKLGQHAAVLSELAMLTAQHPMHENLCALYMIALHRGGRRWQALRAFADLRRTLANDLGVEPSAHLQRIHMAILGAAEPAGPQDREPAPLARLAG